MEKDCKNCGKDMSKQDFEVWDDGKNFCTYLCAWS